MKLTDTFKEARRLHALGFAIHWLHPKSKRPTEMGWAKRPKDKWQYLAETYFDGLNVGVKLGELSPLDGGYLTVIDVDVKSKDKRHKAEALAAVKKIIADPSRLPMVHSGRGGGSRHYYCRSLEAFKTWTPYRSTEIVKVHSPTKKPSKREIAELTASELNEGLRLGPAWEISLYSNGRQVVLPPSIHPDTGAMYVWARHLTKISDLPIIAVPKEVTAEKVETATVADVTDFVFTPTDVELEWLPISDEVKNGIKLLTGITDRSGFLLPATRALLSAGCTRDDVLTILTDSHFAISACAFEHAKTKSRPRAAYWLYKYTLRGIEDERDASKVFSAISELPQGRRLSFDEMAKDDAEWGFDWRDTLLRTGKKGEGGIKSCITNIVTILEHMCGHEVVRHNLFALRDSYGCDTVWGGKVNGTITDVDITKIKYWLSKTFGFEPKNDVIHDAITVIAHKNAFDPVKEMIEALPVWDGKPRLDTWLCKYFKAHGEPAYNGEIFRKWCVGMVMRVYEPGAKFDWMPIFEGPQRAGKSSFGKIMAGGEKYFLDSLPNLQDKDAALGLQGVWVVENAELATLRKTDIEMVKAFTSRTIDKIRPPYGRRVLESPRRCVFLGTTNRDQYLIDETGNRRFKPLIVGRLNFEALKRDRDQLLAEAKHLYDNKIETVITLDQLSEKAAEYEKTVHQNKMLEDESSMMLDMLYVAFSNPEKRESFNLKKLPLFELFDGNSNLAVGPLKSFQKSNGNMQKAGKALKKLGFRKCEIGGRNFWKAENLDIFDEKPTAIRKPTAFDFSEGNAGH